MSAPEREPRERRRRQTAKDTSACSPIIRDKSSRFRLLVAAKNALEIAEKKGKTVHLAVAAATDKWEAILRAAQSLQSSAVALGASPNTSVVEDARLAGLAWSCAGRDPSP